MIHGMGNNDGGDDISPVWWLVGITAATATLYHFLKAKESVTQAPYFEVKEPVFSDLNSVAVRFGQIRELWSMGYMSTEDAVAQLGDLKTALSGLQSAGKVSAANAQDLTARMDRLIKDITEYQGMVA